MITRQWGFPRLWKSPAAHGLPAQTVGAFGRWTRGTLATAGTMDLRLSHPGGTGPVPAGFGYAMDPSDPLTWRRPVRWT